MGDDLMRTRSVLIMAVLAVVTMASTACSGFVEVASSSTPDPAEGTETQGPAPEQTDGAEPSGLVPWAARR